jgi:hypothetical protein
MNGILHELEKYHNYYDLKNFTIELFTKTINEYMEQKERQLESLTEKEYFTPDITDLRVGYKAEYKLAANGSLTFDIWIPFKIEIDKILYYPPWGKETCIINNEDFCINDKIKLGDIRVPFLTKEDIIDRGWKAVKNVTGALAKCIDNEENLFIKGGYALKYYEDVKILSIIYFAGIYPCKVLFEGECKDINTFDYIIKLLKIS